MKNRRSHTRRLSLCSKMSALMALGHVLVLEPAHAQREVALSIETSPTVAGPWTFVPAQEAVVAPDGTLVAKAPLPNGFVRVRMDAGREGEELPFIALENIPAPATERARTFLRDLALPPAEDEVDEEAQAWADAGLGPFVLPFYDPSFREGREPAAYEYKVIGPSPSGGPIGFLAGRPEEPESRERGFILISMDENDAPVPGFGMRGPTPGESLLGLSRSLRGARLFRFGSSFLALEDAEGRLLAHLGTQPFKLPRDLLDHLGQTFAGEFDSDRTVDEPADGWGGPRFVPEAFATYQDFKQDYVDNPVLQAFRGNRAIRNRIDWMIERGESPPVPETLDVLEGTSESILRDLDITRFFLDEDNLASPVATVSQIRAEPGLTVSGLRPGDVDLTVLGDGSVRQYVVRVLPRDTRGAEGAALPMVSMASFTPGWQAPKFWSASSYEATPRYYQWESSEWCPVVGCGPVAWAMILGWWDHKGVPSAFYAKTSFNTLFQSMATADAPLERNPSPTSAWALLRTKYSEIHDACDTICAAGQGATPPGDLVEALPQVTYIARGFAGSATPDAQRYLGMSYGWSWDLLDPNWNTPSNYARASIIAKRPAVLGIGWLWHYVLAYKFRLQEYKFTATGPAVYRRRWFGVNEGWGKNSGAYYTGTDTYLGTNLRFWQRHLPPAN